MDYYGVPVPRLVCIQGQRCQETVNSQVRRTLGPLKDLGLRFGAYRIYKFRVYDFRVYKFRVLGFRVYDFGVCRI